MSGGRLKICKQVAPIIVRFNDMWEFETYMEWIFEKLGHLGPF